MKQETQKTPEELAAEVAATEAAAKAEADKAAKAEAAAAKKAEKEAAATAKKAEREAAKTAKEAEKQAAKTAKEAKRKAKEDAKAAAKATKDATRQPEQNGVRRPGPDGKCGQAWTIFDKLSAELKQPVPIGDALVAAKAAGQNEANVRTEYARWKKFHGIAGRVTKPAEVAAQAAS